jgi:hypothetical protein
MRRGVDSLTPPTAGQARQAAASGITWWGGYLGGASLAGAPWPESAWQAVTDAGIKPLPIWAPSISGDPVVQARQAIAAAERAGLGHELALDTEAFDTANPNLEHFVDAWNQTLARAGFTSVVYDGGRVGGVNYHGTGIEWLPNWDGVASASPRGAHQYQGATTRWGMSVDLDVAGNSFPFGHSQEKVVVSPPQLEALADHLVDSRYRVASVHRQAWAVLQDLRAVPPSRVGAGRAGLEEAIRAIETVVGPGRDGLSFVRGELFQLGMFIRRVREEALRADAGRRTDRPVRGSGTTVVA